MKKSVTKRIRITKTGKMLRRRMASDHFRTNKTKKNLLKKRKRHPLGVPKRVIMGYRVVHPSK